MVGGRRRLRGLTEARLVVYRVGATVQDLWVELQPLLGGAPLRLALQDGLGHLQEGEILVARVVTATTMPTPWGHGACFAAGSERRWQAHLATLPADTAKAALSMLGFHPDDAAEPLPDGLRLYTTAWWVDDDDAVCETLEDDELWEKVGQAIPAGGLSRGLTTRHPRLSTSVVCGRVMARSSLPGSWSVSTR